MRYIHLLLLFLLLAACTHGSVGVRQSNYKEIPTVPVSQTLAQQLGTGSTVTIVEGPNNDLNLTGSGIQFGAYTPFGNGWDVDVSASFDSYGSIRYYIQYTTPSTSGSSRFSYDITGSALDVVLGYRWKFLRPYLGLRRDLYTMTDPTFLRPSVSVLNYFALGGLELAIPLSSGTALSFKADYASSISKDASIKSAEKTTLQVNMIWGLDKRP